MNCIHWFVIEAPDGREYLPARCKKCGAKTVFKAGEEHWSKPIPYPSKVKEEAVK
jgi:hypothetical protein